MLPGVTDRDVDTLRVLLSGDIESQLDLVEAARPGEGLGTLALAAFHEAVLRRFGTPHSKAEIVRFVAAFRTRFTESLGAADVAIGAGEAEQLLEEVLDSTRTRARGQDSPLIGPLLLVLVRDERLDPGELDEFLTLARTRAGAPVATAGGLPESEGFSPG